MDTKGTPLDLPRRKLLPKKTGPVRSHSRTLSTNLILPSSALR